MVHVAALVVRYWLPVCEKIQPGGAVKDA